MNKYLAAYLATLRNWPINLALIDIAWVTVISASAAGAGKVAMNWSARG